MRSKLALTGIVLLALLVRAATTEPLKEHAVHPTGTPLDTAALQQAIDRAARDRLPVVLYPGAFVLNRTIIVPPSVTIRSASGPRATMLVTRGAFPMLSIDGKGERGEISGISFSGPGATAIAGPGGLSWARITDCIFRTELAMGIDCAAIKTTIERCQFGVEGDAPKHDSRHLRIVGDGTANYNFIRDCNFYNSNGDGPSVEIGGGHMVSISGCNFERNRTTCALRISGMTLATLRENWFENNSGFAQVELRVDKERAAGVALEVENGNWFSLSGEGNKVIFDTPPATEVRMASQGGNAMNGKLITSDPDKLVNIGRSRLVGYGQK